MQTQKQPWTPSDYLHLIIVLGLLVIALVRGGTDAWYLFQTHTWPPGEGLVLPIITGLLGFMGQKRALPNGTGQINTGDDTQVNLQPTQAPANPTDSAPSVTINATPP